MADRRTAQLAVVKLRAAIARRRPAGRLIARSDRGSHFRSRALGAVLAACGRRSRQRRLGKVAPVKHELAPHSQQLEAA
jgi:hypothetical protein